MENRDVGLDSVQDQKWEGNMTLSHPSALLIVEQNESVPSLPRYNSYTPGWGKRGAYRWLHGIYSISTRRNSGCLVRAGLGCLSSVKWVSFQGTAKCFFSISLCSHLWPQNCGITGQNDHLKYLWACHARLTHTARETDTEIVSKCLSTVTNVKQYNHRQFR